MADVRIYGHIGRDVTADSVREQLRAYPGANGIRLLINSIGGTSKATADIYDLLTDLPVRLSALIEGKCHSAAVLLLAAAEDRAALPEATIRMHPVRYDIPPAKAPGITEQQFNRMRANCSLLDQFFVGHIAARIDADPQRLAREWATEDLTPLETALELGLIHRIEESR